MPREILKATSGKDNKVRYVVLVPPFIEPGIPSIQWTEDPNFASDVYGKRKEAMRALVFNVSEWVSYELSAINRIATCPGFEVELVIVNRAGVPTPPVEVLTPTPVRQRVRPASPEPLAVPITPTAPAPIRYRTRPNP